MLMSSVNELKQAVMKLDCMSELKLLRERLHEEMLAHLCIFPSEQDCMAWNIAQDHIVRRVVQLTELNMKQRSHKEILPSYAFVLFGSAGRQEQTLFSDQDNGLIYSLDMTIAEEDRNELNRFFIEFGEQISANLEKVGFPPCEGGVLCANSLWNKPVDQWIADLDQWLAEPNWESIRYTLIVADARCLYGEADLVARVTSRLRSQLQLQPTLLGVMLNNTLRHKVLLGVFGQWLTEAYGEGAGGIDLKYGAYIPMVNAIRLLSLQYDTGEVATRVRLEGLMAKTGTLKNWQAVQEAFSWVLRARLWSGVLHQANGEDTKEPHRSNAEAAAMSHLLHLHWLTKDQQRTLKNCLRIGVSVQRFVKRSVMRSIKGEEKEGHR